MASVQYVRSRFSTVSICMVHDVGHDVQYRFANKLPAVKDVYMSGKEFSFDSRRRICYF